MSRYTWIQKKLHHLALSSQAVRESSFDIEKTFFSDTSSYGDHVFVVGMARSGTTAILNAIHQSEEFASLSYQDMPFILAPNFWAKFSSKRDTDPMDREHEDGIKISVKSPEAFEEVFWKTFSDQEPDSKQKFKTFVQIIAKKYDKKRYLSKNNQNIRRVELIENIFPDAKILLTYRDPVEQSFSLLKQHKSFIRKAHEDDFLSSYMKWIGHTEFGPHYSPIIKDHLSYQDPYDINHWLEQWFLVYQAFLKQPTPNKFFVNYESLCSNKNLWIAIQDTLNLKSKYSYEFFRNSKEINLNLDKRIVGMCNETYTNLLNSSFS